MNYIYNKNLFFPFSFFDEENASLFSRPDWLEEKHCSARNVWSFDLSEGHHSIVGLSYILYSIIVPPSNKRFRKISPKFRIKLLLLIMIQTE